MGVIVAIFSFLGRLFGLLPSADERLGEETIKNADLRATIKEKETADEIRSVNAGLNDEQLRTGLDKWTRH